MSDLPSSLYFSGYHIEEDLPGQRLALVWRGASPRKLARLLPLLGLIGVFVLAALVVKFMVLPELQNPQGRPGDWIPMLAFAGFLVIAGVITFFKAGSAVGQAVGYWRELMWDTRESALQGKFSGMFLLGRRSLMVPLTQIDGIKFSIGPEDAGLLTIRMELDYRTLNGKVDSFATQFSVEEVDRRAEAVDLLFRIARICGLRGYLILRHTHRRLDISLVPNLPAGGVDERRDDEDELDDDLDDELEDGDEESAAEDEELAYLFDKERWQYKIEPVPDDRSVARYGMNWEATSFQPPEIEVPPFYPAKLAEDIELTQLTAWEPGQQVRFHRPAFPLAGIIALAAVGGFAGAIVLGFPAFPVVTLVAGGDVPSWAAFAIGAALGAALMVIGFSRRFSEREVTFDWSTASVHWREGGRLGHTPLSKIRHLALGGVRGARSERDGGGPTKSQTSLASQLYAVLPERDLLIIETDPKTLDSEESFRQLLPLTAALAKALNVPWRCDDDLAGGSVPPWLSWSRGQIAAVVVVLALAGVGLWALKTPGASKPSAEMLATIQATGAEHTFLNGYGFRQILEIKNFNRLSFPPPAGTDEKVLTLAPAFPKLGRLGLEISGCPVTDACLPAIGQAQNLLYLDLSRTQVTDDGIAALPVLDRVEFINLSGTGVGDQAAAHLALFPKLQVLLLGGTQVTDEGILQLRISRSLKYLHVLGSQVTPRGAQRLRQALPHLEISFDG